uniref:Uncharacterized protein n=1 Tax=Amphimedon queenslandica TaxID=400682 RepID=A0A1X7UPW7_AMPQE
KKRRQHRGGWGKGGKRGRGKEGGQGGRGLGQGGRGGAPHPTTHVLRYFDMIASPYIWIILAMFAERQYSP